MSAAASEPSITPQGAPGRAARSARRRRAVRPDAPRARRWIFLLVVALALAGGVALLLRSGGDSSLAASATGAIATERTSHDFGQVPMGGGLLSTRFPLTAGSEALVTSILSS